ncbi:MAG: putative methyltransferase [Arenicella sp.]|jgi:predicted methyltransferase
MHKSLILVSLLAFSAAISSTVFAQDEKPDSELKTIVEAAMQSEIRSDKESDRDRNRKPVSTLEFFGITPDMKVLELFPGGGWYTKLLGPLLKDKGQLYIAMGTSYAQKSVLNLAAMDKVSVLNVDVEFASSETKGLRTVGPIKFSENSFDATLTFRNMHNFDSAGRNNVNQAVFDALKPGGIYGVVDHTLRHMEPFSAENRRRADPVAIIKELLDIGFKFEAYSNLHYRPDDELRYEVGRKSVTGNTDRFTFLFRKPK